MAKQLFQKLKLVDDENLQRLIEKRIRHYDQTTSALAKLQMEMLDVFSRNDITPEERVSLLTAINHRYKNLKDKPSSNFAPEPAPELVPPPPPENFQNDSLNASAIVQEPVDQSLLDMDLSARALSPVAGRTRHVKAEVASPHVSNPKDAKAFALISELIAHHQDKLSADEKTGELIVNNEKIQGSNFEHLVAELIVHKGYRNLTGKEKFLSMLSNISEEDDKLVGLVKNRKMRGKIVEKQEGKGQKGRGQPPGKSVHIMYLY